MKKYFMSKWTHAIWKFKNYATAYFRDVFLNEYSYTCNKC